MRAALLTAAIGLAGCTDSGAADRIDASTRADAQADEPPAAPAIHLKNDQNFMDTAWCHISLVPIQDPVFPTIRRDRFEATADGIVITPASWIEEAKTRVPELQMAADTRGKRLLEEATRVVGRPFVQRDFDFLLYFCPFFGGGSAIPGIYPVFQYLESAVGELQIPDWIFSDQYMFHEIVHRFVMERIDYTVGTPMLNAVYTAVAGDGEFQAAVAAHLGHAPSESEFLSYVGLVMTHIHVYAIMTRTYLALDEATNLERIRSYETENANPHPSYVKAWEIVGEYSDSEVEALLAEVR